MVEEFNLSEKIEKVNVSIGFGISDNHLELGKASNGVINIFVKIVKEETGEENGKSL